MLGIIFSLLAGICYGLGIAVQKRGMGKNKKLNFKKLLKNGTWLLGNLIGIPGFLIYLAALKYAPVNVVQALITIAMPSSILFGYFFLKEKMRGIQWVGILIILTGCLVISVF